MVCWLFFKQCPSELKLRSDSTSPTRVSHPYKLRQWLEEDISHQKVLTGTSNRQQQWRDIVIPLEIWHLIYSWNVFHAILPEEGGIYGILKTEVTTSLSSVCRHWFERDLSNTTTLNFIHIVSNRKILIAQGPKTWKLILLMLAQVRPKRYISATAPAFLPANTYSPELQGIVRWLWPDEIIGNCCCVQQPCQVSTCSVSHANTSTRPSGLRCCSSTQAREW